MGLIILFLLVFSSMLLIYYKTIKEDYIPTIYESELIEYFKEVALKSEIGENVNKTIKWPGPMFLYVIKDRNYEKQMKAIHETIHKINNLSTDGFKIVLTEDKTKTNAILYLLNKRKVDKLDSYFFDGIDYDFAGLSEARHNRKHNITSAKIFVDVEEPLEIQKSIILEEITQSIGLMNDSEKYSNSIFFEHQMNQDSIILEYLPIDKDIIKLLYHPRMKPDLDSVQTEKVIKSILKNKEVELSGA